MSWGVESESRETVIGTESRGHDRKRARTSLTCAAGQRGRGTMDVPLLYLGSALKTTAPHRTSLCSLPLQMEVTYNRLTDKRQMPLSS
jgi:hypothetical protein